MDEWGSNWHPVPLEGLVRRHPVASLKEGDNSIKPELNHLWSTNLWPQSPKHTAKKSASEYFDDIVSSLAASVYI